MPFYRCALLISFFTLVIHRHCLQCLERCAFSKDTHFSSFLLALHSPSEYPELEGNKKTLPSHTRSAPTAHSDGAPARRGGTEWHLTSLTTPLTFVLCCAGQRREAAERGCSREPASDRPTASWLCKDSWVFLCFSVFVVCVCFWF